MLVYGVFLTLSTCHSKGLCTKSETDCRLSKVDYNLDLIQDNTVQSILYKT